MSEQTHNSQQTIVIGLVVVAVLLAAIVGVSDLSAEPGGSGTHGHGAPADSDRRRQSLPQAWVVLPPAWVRPGRRPDGVRRQDRDQGPGRHDPRSLVKAYWRPSSPVSTRTRTRCFRLDTQKSYGDANAYADAGQGVRHQRSGETRQAGRERRHRHHRRRPRSPRRCRSATRGPSRRSEISGSWLRVPWAASSTGKAPLATAVPCEAGRPTGALLAFLVRTPDAVDTARVLRWRS